MVSRIEFKIPKGLILNSNVKMHHIVKANKVSKIRTYARDFSAQLLNNTFNHFNILVLVKPPTKRRLDPANLYPTVKPIIDGMTDSGWWEDDDYEHLDTLSFKYGGTSGEKGFYKIEFVIEEIEKEV